MSRSDDVNTSAGGAGSSSSPTLPPPRLESVLTFHPFSLLRVFDHLPVVLQRREETAESGRQEPSSPSSLSSLFSSLLSPSSSPPSRSMGTALPAQLMDEMERLQRQMHTWVDSLYSMQSSRVFSDLFDFDKSHSSSSTTQSSSSTASSSHALSPRDQLLLRDKAHSPSLPLITSPTQPVGAPRDEMVVARKPSPSPPTPGLPMPMPAPGDFPTAADAQQFPSILPPFAGLFSLLGSPFYDDDWGDNPPIDAPRKPAAKTTAIYVSTSTRVFPDGTVVTTRVERDGNGSETVTRTMKQTEPTSALSPSTVSTSSPALHEPSLPSPTDSPAAADGDGLYAKVKSWLTW